MNEVKKVKNIIGEWIKTFKGCFILIDSPKEIHDCFIPMDSPEEVHGYCCGYDIICGKCKKHQDE